MLGLDLGTSFFKGAVLHLDSGITHIRRVPTPTPVAGLPPGHHELSPAVVVEAVRTLLTELLAIAPDACGIVMCGQMHCVVLVDSSGQPRSNIITWKDQRGVDGLMTHLLRLVTPEERRQIGRELRVGLPIVNLSWLRTHAPLEPGLIPTSLADFVLSQLCGTVPTTEATNAAAYGLFNVEAGTWHDELIAKLGLADLRWPRIRPFGDIVGTAEIDGRRLTCFTPVGDQQCALAGAELAARELSLNISTGSQISLLSSRPTGGEFQVRPYFDGQWLRTIVQIPAGRSLQALVNLLTEMGGDGGAWDYIARRTEETPDTDLKVDLTFFVSEFGSSGSIGNIREDNLNVGSLFVAAFRHMAENYARCAEGLSPDRAWDRVVFSGGLVQRYGRLRREILERLGDPPWRLSPTEEDTLHGLLMLARRVS
jgi:sugar (pentulose or hexulose) kinase